jgi:hypothetical protein
MARAGPVDSRTRIRAINARKRFSPYNDPSEARTAEAARDWTDETGAGPRTRPSCTSREGSLNPLA